MKHFSIALFLTALAQAQVYTPPPQQQTTNSTPQDTVVREKSTPSSSTGGLFGNELPFYNPSNELISFNGQTWASSDNRLMEARFEKYLNEPEESSQSARDYRQTIDEILSTLAPLNKKKNRDKLYQAFTLLPRASSYPGDSRLCDSLANAIYTALLAKKDISGTKNLIKALESEKI